MLKSFCRLFILDSNDDFKFGKIDEFSTDGDSDPVIYIFNNNTLYLQCSLYFFSNCIPFSWKWLRPDIHE